MNANCRGALVKWIASGVMLASMLVLDGCVAPHGSHDAAQLQYSVALSRVTLKTGLKDRNWFTDYTADLLVESEDIVPTRVAAIMPLTERPMILTWRLSPGRYRIAQVRFRKSGMRGSEELKFPIIVKFAITDTGQIAYLGDIEFSTSTGELTYTVRDKFASTMQEFASSSRHNGRPVNLATPTADSSSPISN